MLLLFDEEIDKNESKILLKSKTEPKIIIKKHEIIKEHPIKVNQFEKFKHIMTTSTDKRPKTTVQINVGGGRRDKFKMHEFKHKFGELKSEINLENRIECDNNQYLIDEGANI